MKISTIKIGDRPRKDMGDLAELVASMERVGMLHPVVVTKEGILVAGQRRIEAAKILKWPEVPVTVISTTDLLSAERDENTVRKDFTPTEAVAIGRLIEEQERPKARIERVEKITTTMRKRAAGEDLGESPRYYRSVTDRVAAAVGMERQQYDRAKKVVSAAEAEPEKFGDLPARMDETKNVSGTYRELQERKTGTGRHAVHYKKRYPKTNDMIRRAINSLDGICAALTEVKAEEADASEAPAWAKSLEESASAIRQFSRRLKNVKG
jgi:ParB family chromosome partitioning protein